MTMYIHGFGACVSSGSAPALSLGAPAAEFTTKKRAEGVVEGIAKEAAERAAEETATPHSSSISPKTEPPSREPSLGGAAVEALPAKEYIPARMRRKMGRLAQLMYIAAARALGDAALTEPFEAPLVTGTAFGELSVGLALVPEILRHRGKDPSPIAIQNSVHNAPAGHLTIGLQNRSPAWTVSHGLLSAEAALDAAAVLLQTTEYQHVLVLCGDVYQPEWCEQLRLAQATELAHRLAQEQYHEGAAALLLSSTPSSTARYGALLDVRLEHLPQLPPAEILSHFGLSLPPHTTLLLRQIAGGEALLPPLRQQHKRVFSSGPPEGTSFAAPFLQLARLMAEESSQATLLLAQEQDDLGLIYWQRHLPNDAPLPAL